MHTISEEDPTTIKITTILLVIVIGVFMMIAGGGGGGEDNGLCTTQKTETIMTTLKLHLHLLRPLQVHAEMQMKLY